MEKPPRSWGEMTIQFFDELIFFSQNWIGNNFHYYRYWKTPSVFESYLHAAKYQQNFHGYHGLACFFHPPKHPCYDLWHQGDASDAWHGSDDECHDATTWDEGGGQNPAFFVVGRTLEIPPEMFIIFKELLMKKKAPNKQDKWSPKTTGSAVNLQIAIPKSPSLLAHTILATGVLGNIESLHWHILPWLRGGYAVLTTCLPELFVKNELNLWLTTSKLGRRSGRYIYPTYPVASCQIQPTSW